MKVDQLLKMPMDYLYKAMYDFNNEWDKVAVSS